MYSIPADISAIFTPSPTLSGEYVFLHGVKIQIQRFAFTPSVHSNCWYFHLHEVSTLVPMSPPSPPSTNLRRSEEIHVVLVWPIAFGAPNMASSILARPIAVQDQAWRRLQRVMDIAGSFTRIDLPTTERTYRKCCLKKAAYIIKKPREKYTGAWKALPRDSRIPSLFWSVVKLLSHTAQPKPQSYLSNKLLWTFHRLQYVLWLIWLGFGYLL